MLKNTGYSVVSNVKGLLKQDIGIMKIVVTDFACNSKCKKKYKSNQTMVQYLQLSYKRNV